MQYVRRSSLFQEYLFSQITFHYTKAETFIFHVLHVNISPESRVSSRATTTELRGLFSQSVSFSSSVKRRTVVRGNVPWRCSHPEFVIGRVTRVLFQRHPSWWRRPTEHRRLLASFATVIWHISHSLMTKIRGDSADGGAIWPRRGRTNDNHCRAIKYRDSSRAYVHTHCVPLRLFLETHLLKRVINAPPAGVPTNRR